MSDFNEAIPGKVAQATDEDLAEQTAELMEQIRKLPRCRHGFTNMHVGPHGDSACAGPIAEEH